MHKILFYNKFITRLHMFRAHIARNMYRHVINLLQNKILCIKLVNYLYYTEKHGQQNKNSQPRFK